MSRGDMPALFREAPLRAVFESQQREMQQALDAMSASQFRSQPDAEIVDDLLSRFGIEPVRLTEGATSVIAEESKVDVSGSWERDIMDRSRPFYVDGIDVSYYVPFTGDPSLFRFQPSTFSFHLPRGEVSESEIAFHFERPDTNVAATKHAFEEELRRLKEWLKWTNQDVESFNTSFVTLVRGAVAQRRNRLQALDTGIETLGIPIRRAGSTSVPLPPSSGKAASPKVDEYDVALSFAGEDRLYVEKVAAALKAFGVRVFYDAFQTTSLWGKNLVDHLADIYQHRSRFVVMFVSQHYVAKAWPTHERQHAQARALVAKGEYILPARFDDTEVPGMTNTVAYIDLRHVSPDELADLIREKLA